MAKLFFSLSFEPSPYNRCSSFLRHGAIPCALPLPPSLHLSLQQAITLASYAGPSMFSFNHLGQLLHFAMAPTSLLDALSYVWYWWLVVDLITLGLYVIWAWLFGLYNLVKSNFLFLYFLTMYLGLLLVSLWIAIFFYPKVHI